MSLENKFQHPLQVQQEKHILFWVESMCFLTSHCHFLIESLTAVRCMYRENTEERGNQESVCSMLLKCKSH